MGDTSNFHFSTIPSSLGISIDGIQYYTDIFNNVYAHNTRAYINVQFYTNSVKNVETL